ncbi:hypothetical protein GCM10022222_77700 [Amycolatopsis ultiminotia]|uniref:SRPBCC family protein n=2 Tax=Amycolatopsis ultiminotia TaxID=543629 RepID=A0ABP6YFS2_9PSEU
MGMVRMSVELPVPAETAAALARKPDVMAFVLSPVLRLRRLEVPARLEVGARGRARLWWFGVLPTWTHHLVVDRLDPTEIRTSEHGGPVRMWNHRLVFVPLPGGGCRYTDEIEVEDGWRGTPVRLFARLMFGHRHRRWQVLAQLIS